MRNALGEVVFHQVQLSLAVERGGQGGGTLLRFGDQA